jgi:hypothetical protein
MMRVTHGSRFDDVEELIAHNLLLRVLDSKHTISSWDSMRR